MVKPAGAKAFVVPEIYDDHPHVSIFRFLSLRGYRALTALTAPYQPRHVSPIHALHKRE
jgi:hypothetical protein